MCEDCHYYNTPPTPDRSVQRDKVCDGGGDDADDEVCTWKAIFLLEFVKDLEQIDNHFRILLSRRQTFFSHILCKLSNKQLC